MVKIGFGLNNKITRAVRDCLIRPYARTSEYFVSYLGLDYECKVGYNDPIWNVNSIYHAIYWVYRPTLKLESQKAFEQQYKSQQDQETYYTSVCTKFGRIYLNWWGHECRRRPFLCLPWTPLTGDKIIVTLVYLVKMSSSHRGWIRIVLIWTLILPIVVQ